MEDNKLKQEIWKIQFEEFGNLVMHPATDKLYSLTADVAVKFQTWFEDFVDYDDKADDYYFMPNMVVKTKHDCFSYFLTHIYQPR